MAMKAATLSGISTTSMYIKAALFHSSPVLDRKRRTHWDTSGGSFRDAKRNHYYSRRSRKIQAKHTLLRNVSAYAEQLFKSWHDDDYDDPSSSNDSSWFRRQYRSTKRTSSQRPRWDTYWSRGFQFCDEDDEDVQTIFRSAMGGARFTYFVEDQDVFEEMWSSNHSNKQKKFRSSRFRREYNYETYEENDSGSHSGLTSERVALGLNASGPLKLDDVKSAYRACALKWHPDRHLGSSKAVAEERFKLCSAAYQTLCDKLE